ncbi:MAG TPA: peptidoglycan DD-metalloendopeptidase family protein [Bacilli bacterium]|nr:peptidoglycan DD-metalloendopeptidase family protein [Bacilli bacterium]
MKRFITYILLVIFMIGIVSPGLNPVSAKSIAELEKELQALKDERSTINSEESDAKSKIKENERQQSIVQEKINQLDGEIFATESNIASKQEEINVTNGEIQALENSIAETEGQIEATEEELEELADQIEELIERIEERDVLIKNRLRSMQHSGGSINYLQVLFGSQSFGDFINRATAVSKIYESDRTIMSAQERDKSDLEDTEVEVEEKKDQLVADKEKLDAEKVEVESKRATLLAQQNELSNLKAQLNQQRDTQVATANELEEEHYHLEEAKLSLEEQRQVIADQEKLLNELKDKKIAQLANEEQQNSGSNGSLIWPNGGTVTSEYGMRHHPIYKVDKLHGGIDIGGNAGLEIRAAADGLVIGTYDSGTTGFGRYIVIRHEEINMTTLYAHLSSVNVTAGQTVNQGEQIGVMGTTGSSTGVHLHFEVFEGKYGEGRVNPRTHLP